MDMVMNYFYLKYAFLLIYRAKIEVVWNTAYYNAARGTQFEESLDELLQLKIKAYIKILQKIFEV